MKRSISSSVYSNEDAPTQSFEQRVTTPKSSDSQLEKELEQLGETLNSLERRKNDLIQEVQFPSFFSRNDDVIMLEW